MQTASQGCGAAWRASGCHGHTPVILKGGVAAR